MTVPDRDSDEALAASSAEGSRAAFEELVARFGGSVVSVMERRLGDHHIALDLAQEAWIRVFRALPRFDATRSFRSWLFSIVLNVARDEGRRRERSRVVYLDEFRGTLQQGSPADALAEKSVVDASLALVAEPFRTAIVLVDVEGLSYGEAAQCLGCSVGTVKSRVHRGRLAFRDSWLRLSGDAAEELIAGGHS